MAAPAWITSPELGSFSEDYSFSINPITVLFTAPAGTNVSVLNGSLPPGLQYQRVGNSLVIKGESTGTPVAFTSMITWRLTAPGGTVSDRTYSITITPVTNPPNWDSQDPDLGYAISGETSTYRVRATTDTGMEITYAIAAFSPPTGLSIDGYTGVITYAAPVVASDQTISFNVMATTGSASSILACRINLLALPHAPVWITPAGLVGEVEETRLLEVVLRALEPNGAPLTFTLDSASPSFPFTFDSSTLSGDEVFIYGEAPEVFQDTVYIFTVTASSAYGSATRTFEVLASPVNPSERMAWTNPTGDLGVTLDGQYVTIDVSAVSTRGQVTHNIVGGILPTHLLLNRIPGVIIGFLEFQTRDRQYVFDIRATDGVQVLERTFVMTVRKRTNTQYMGISIPIEGPLKESYYSYVGSTVLPGWVPYSDSTPQYITYTPSIQLISGLNYSIDQPARAVGFANLHMHTTELMIGATTNVNVSPTTTLFYSQILDSDAGAAYQYNAIGGPVCYTNSTVTVQTGNITVHTSKSERQTWLVPGSQVKLASMTDPANFMQGTVTSFRNSFLTVHVTAKGGSGSWAGYDIYPATQYPPGLENSRVDLISGLGWASDGQGSGASLLPIIDLATGGISNVQVVHQGGGFLYSPTINVIGAGNGAVVTANLTVVGGSIIHQGAGYELGAEYVLYPPAVDRAIMRVSGTTASGGITQVSVTYGGEYSRFPAGPYMLYEPNAAIQAQLTIDLGIGNVSVIAGGQGYTTGKTVVDTAGRELLPAWQGEWFPYVACGKVYTQYGDNVVRQETPAVTAEWWYKRFPWQHAILELQGIEWLGDTTFDGMETTFDGGYTFLAEWREPKNTLFEQDLTTFDQSNTYFDWNLLWGGVAYAAWGDTLFDLNFTVFDLYSTVFDEGVTPTRSITLLRKLLRITTTQYSGHNVVV